jgi:chemotaxis regulatin CheY-phosphate phosphatase CheZ
MHVEFDQFIGGCVAVIVAGMPAMVALLKIRQLHLTLNSRLDKFLAATAQAARERLEAVVKDRDEIRTQNARLIEHANKLAKQLDDLNSERITIEHASNLAKQLDDIHGQLVQKEPPR